MKIIKGFCCIMFLFMMSLCDASRLIRANKKVEVTKISTRTPVKSIMSPDGDMIDCIHISHQPAFDHPLLKNHTIQMRPSYFPEESKMSTPNSKNETQAIIQLWHLNDECPEGTIPIRRTTQEDMFRANTIKKKLMNSITQIPAVDSAHHEYAGVTTYSGKYYGAKATISVWNPQPEPKINGFSLSQLWISGGFGPYINTIEVGWIVFPLLYGDTKTRLFTYWTGDNYQSTGCYDMLCAGFVQTSKKVALGLSMKPLSVYHGSQFIITLFVWKDPKGMWWLRYGNEVVGYWPASLFNSIAESASLVQWGGEVATTEFTGPHTKTPMGSGHFAEEGFRGASYFKNLHVVDRSNSLRPPGQLGSITGNPNCYSTKVGHSKDWEDYFFYGGPGRNPNCP